MPRVPMPPVFVDKKAAAEMLMISVDTFDTWLRAGFLPQPQIERGQIVRWHWPTLESHLAGDGEGQHRDPFMEGLKNVKKGRSRVAA